MVKFVALLSLLALNACSVMQPPMTNDQVIAATKQCADAGLKPVAFSQGDLDSRIVYIQCQPKEEKP